jgi:hypothetical protein
MNNSLLSYIENIFNDIGNLVIDEEFISLRNKMKNRLGQGDRSDIKFTKDVDCLVLEEYLIKMGLVNAPLKEHIHRGGACVYDAIVKTQDKNSYIDFKCIPSSSSYYNVSKHKMKTHEWVQSGINSGILTHYCFYKMHRPFDKPLMVGDDVRFELINVVQAQHVMNNLTPSKYGGKYWRVPKYARTT